MLQLDQLEALMADLESDRVERTVSTKDKQKFCEAVCAFSNDFPGHRQPGYLLIGVDNDGQPARLELTDAFLTGLGGLLRSDGNILPLPALSVERVSLPGGRGDVAVVTVHPSELPPVRYDGRCHIRVGPRRALATPAEEHILAERATAHARTFDARPCVGSALSDLALDLFTLNYRLLAVAPEVIEENNRELEEQLASLRFFDLERGCPTNAGVLLFGKDVQRFFPGAYVQFVRYSGVDVGSPVLEERAFAGDLVSLLRDLDGFLPQQVRSRPVAVSMLREELVSDYPLAALREFLLNAMMHRQYEAATAPIRLTWFEEHVEIQNPGGLYGDATPENFPRQNAYRNPVVAEALKVLGYVNRFGFGVRQALSALRANGNPADPKEIFDFDRMFVRVTLRRRA